MSEKCYNIFTSKIKSGRSDAGNILRPDTRKVKFLMQSHSTRTPSFPANLSDYAPWVTTHGLFAPYGQCQCGCGHIVSIANSDYLARGWREGHPVRFVVGHHNKARTKTPLAVRFWRKVRRASRDVCWEWQGYRNRFGYGQIGDESGKAQLVSRVSWQLHFGPIPDGIFVCHACDNPSCVNPHHLFLGTPSDNSLDMSQKQRNPRGESSPVSKLTLLQVKDVLSRHARGETRSEIARSLSMSFSTIADIINRKTWSHVEVPTK